MSDDIRRTVRAVVTEVLGLDEDELHDDGDFFGDYGCSSLRAMGLRLGLERRLGFRFDADEGEHLTSVGEILRLLERYSVKAAR
jgi:acyl carrier protein